MIHSRLVDIIDENISDTIFTRSMTVEVDHGLINGGCGYKAIVWWSYLTGLNVSVIDEGFELCRVSPLLSPTFSKMGKNSRETAVFAKQLRNYTTHKTKDLYVDVITKPVKVPCELFSIDNGVICPNENIKFNLARTLHALKKSTPRTGTIALNTRDFEEVGEDTPGQGPSVCQYHAKSSGDIVKIFMELYNKTHDVIRNDNKEMCLPNVWKIDDDAYLEFTPHYGFEFTLFENNVIITQLTRIKSYTTDDDNVMPFITGVQAELEFATTQLYETEFEKCVVDIVNAYRTNANIQKGGVGTSKWEITTTKNDISSDSDSDSDISSDSDSDSDISSDSDSDSDSDNDSCIYSDSDSDDLSNEIEEENDIEDETNDDGEIPLELCIGSLTDDSGEVDILFVDGLEESMDNCKKYSKDVKMFITGYDTPFWESSDAFDGFAFRTRGYVALSAVLKQIETMWYQSTVALAIISQCEKVLQNPKARRQINLGMTKKWLSADEIFSFRLSKHGVAININGRILIKKPNGKTLDARDDSVFDRIITRWKPFSKKMCVICHNEGGIMTKCCGNITHASCITKWAETCVKNKTPVTCPMCRNGEYI